MSRLYEPLHPAILRAIRLVVRAGRRARIPVAVCGEMAADPVLLALLVGLGLREFSMTPTAIPLAKHVIRGLRVADARVAAGRALTRAHGRRSRERVAGAGADRPAGIESAVREIGCHRGKEIVQWQMK